MIGRRTLLAGAGVTPLLPAGASVEAVTAIEEWTFLKSIDPDPAALIAFIRANWFAMDRIAVERGLFTGYALRRSDDPGNWNVVVTVGYPDARGYDGVREAFEAIRRAHVEVPIDGRAMKDLGRIIGSRRLLPA